MDEDEIFQNRLIKFKSTSGSYLKSKSNEGFISLLRKKQKETLTSSCRFYSDQKQNNVSLDSIIHLHFPILSEIGLSNPEKMKIIINYLNDEKISFNNREKLKYLFQYIHKNLVNILNEDAYEDFVSLLFEYVYHVNNDIKVIFNRKKF